MLFLSYSSVDSCCNMVKIRSKPGGGRVPQCHLYTVPTDAGERQLQFIPTLVLCPVLPTEIQQLKTKVLAHLKEMKNN